MPPRPISIANFRQILTTTLAAPVILIGICAIILALITGHLLKVIRLDRHSVEVIAVGHEWEKLIIDMETGLRGYKMTGDSRFLEPYNLAEPQVDAQYARLIELTSDNPEQTAALQDADKLVLQWRDIARKSIQDGQYKGGPDALDDALSRKALMDSIRSQIATFIAHENQLLNQRSEKVDSTERTAYAISAVVLALVTLVIGLHVYRQMLRLSESYLASYRDLTTQKEWLRVTLSSIGDAVIVTDANGHVDFMNAEAERMTGWTSLEVKSKPLRSIFRIVNEETRRSVDDPVEKVFREKRIVGLANHTLLLSKNGAEWPIEDSAAPIYDTSKNMVGVVLVFHDATEMRRAERILKTHAEDLEQKVLARTLELQRMVNELEAFSYTVSHDLRAPLRAMQGYSNALLEDFSEKWGAEERDLLIRINRAAQRLDILIQDVLTYSKVSKERQAVVPVELDRLVPDILSQYPTFQDPKLKIEVQRPLAVVLGHESGLTQVISNVLTNAIKFVDANRVPEIKIWTDSTEFRVRLWIQDNGIGVDPENHIRIFKMFEQVNSKSYEGTGIGLAIAKKAIENMHGAIGIESKLGEGTRVWIELLKPGNA